MFEGKKILITGGTGSLGQALTKRLLKSDVDIIRIFSRNESKQIEMASKISDKRLRFLLGDIRDYDRLNRALEDIDIVFHVAALKHVPVIEYNPFEGIKTNVIGSQNVISACLEQNVGVREANGEFIIILNPDTIIEPNCINELIFAYNKFGEGLYQPKILSLDEENIIQSTGNMLHVFGFGFARDKGRKVVEKVEDIEKIGYASGTCLFTSKDVIDKVGLLDEFLFLYHDDLDLGWRAAQIGIDSYYVPKSKVFHVESYSLKWSSKKFYWLERNRKYCLLTHYSKKHLKR